MRDLLKEKGYKATPARLAILDIFAKNNAPITALKVYKELQKNKKHREINEATIYRTLTVLEEGGILRKVDFRKDASFFELNKDHHHHITCLNCDTIENFESQTIEKVLRGIVRNSSRFNIVKEHSLELFGLCKNCA